MKKEMLEKAAEYAKAQKKTGRWKKAAVCLSALVMFCTVLVLILPAAAWEKKQCDIPEHQHTEECYTQITSVTRTVPVCSAEKLNLHKHTKECYDNEKHLICGYADFVVHKHNESCYNEDGTLWCPFPEIEAHTHTDACFAAVNAAAEVHQHTESCYTRQRGNLICGLAESEGHTHSAEAGCYDENGELICQLAESEGHEHTDDCYAWNDVLTCGLSTEPVTVQAAEPEVICGKEEIIPHEHTDACYDKDNVLICDRTVVLEHVHTEECFETIEEPVDTSVLTCGLAEDENHTHSALCYGTWELTCGMEEHTHDEACQGKAEDDPEEKEDKKDADTDPEEEQEASEKELGEEEQTRIEELIAAIEELPDYEEIQEALNAYEEAGDDEGYEAYFEELYTKVMAIYANYEDLDPKMQELVTNREKLLEFEWLWSAMPMDVTNTVGVTAVNSFSWSGYGGALIVHGDNGLAVGNSGMGQTDFKYWCAVQIENENNHFVVKQIKPNDGSSKTDVGASGTGFVLLYHPETLGAYVNVSVGDSVRVSSDFWKTTKPYNGIVCGTVTFSDPVKPKPEKDNTGELNIIQGADTSELIEVNLYDYGEHINELYNGDHNYPGFQQPGGTTSIENELGPYSFNFGDNITSDLRAGNNRVTNKGGDINKTAEGANQPISDAISNTLKDGYPALADGTSLAYLFSSGSYASKENTNSINGLFQYNETTGAYTFNSRENHAQFNQGSDTFTLYEQMITSNFMMYPFGNFLPFNDITKQSKQASQIDRGYLETIAKSAAYKNQYDQTGLKENYGTLSTVMDQFINLMDKEYGNKNWTGTDCLNKYFELNGIPKHFEQDDPQLRKLYSIDYDEPTDFYFGMEMKMNFMQPKGGRTGKDGNHPMVFYFTGDDDVWVYVDEKLFLDLSGIHRHVGGEIDFEKGVVRYYSLSKTTGDVSGTPYETVEFKDLVEDASLLNENGTFKDYSSHSFNFYYMERGAGSGVCRMNFNFPLLKQNSISVQKELTVDEKDKLDLLGNPDFSFQVLKADGNSNKTGELFVKDGVTYDIYNEKNEKVGSGTTDANGVFTIKAGQRAEFAGIPENAGKYYVRELLDEDVFAQYRTITVDGTSQTQNYDVTVGSDTFKGVDSPIKDMSDGSTVFNFNNQVRFKKLGSLEISKVLQAYSGTDTNKEFEFEVTLDGALIPVETVYIVVGENGEKEEKTVATEGIITVPAGKTAKISNIIAGSQFTVKETSDSANGYTVSYEGSEGVTTSGDSASGMITANSSENSSVKVTVTNSEKGTSVTIPVEKTISNPDGKKHTFKFKLEQVRDWSGKTPVEGGTEQELELTEIENMKDGAFTLVYLEKDISESSATFYYKITEIADGTLVDFDESAYVAEVTVSKNGNELESVVSGLWKDGKELTTTDGELLKASFTNTLLRDLTIQKTVVGPVSDGKFRFELTVKNGEVGLIGTYDVTRTTEPEEGSKEEPETIIFTNGKTEFELGNKEAITIHKLPYGAEWSIKEINTDGFSVSWTVGEETTKENPVDGSLNDNITIVCTNTGTFELPETGGLGMYRYLFGGILLTISALLCMVMRKPRSSKRR